MHFMNDYDIGRAIRVFERDVADFPIALGAALTLDAFREWVDTHSDGWAHWAPPVRAADRLMTLIETAEEGQREGRQDYDMRTETYSYRDIDPAALKAAYANLKRFATRYNRGQWGNRSGDILNFEDLISTVQIVPADD